MIECLPSSLAMANSPNFEKGSTALNFVNTDDNALHKAVRLGKLRLTRLLVEGGTDIQSIDDDGRSALILACVTKYEHDAQNSTKLKMVKMFLEHGAKVDVQDKHGRTCLMYACMERAGIDVIKLLLKYDADPRITDKNGSSALVHAVNARDSSVLTLLIETCKNKGKEVIIITTSDRGKEKSAKQYLNVPPSLAQSPPFYQCISPSQVELTAPASLEVHNSVTRAGSCNALSPKTIRKRDRSLTDSPANTPETSPRSPVSSPRTHQRLQLALQPPPLQNRRLVRRSSMGLLYDTGSMSPSRSHPDLPEETEEDTLKVSSANTPVLLQSSHESLHKSPRTYRCSLLRRQSADAFNPSLLRASNPRLHPTTLNPANSTPEKRPLNKQEKSNVSYNNNSSSSTSSNNSNSRRGSLPAMPPPLRRSQTVHAINVAKSIIEMNKSTDSNYESDANSNSDIPNNESPLATLEYGKKLGLGRRGSAPFLLEDELSYKRPGTLPPLNINPRPPIPDIGSTVFKPSPRLGRHGDREVHRKLESALERRFSIQTDDMQRLTNMYKGVSDYSMHESQQDTSGDSGAESS